MSWSGLAGVLKQTSKKIVNLSLAGIISVSGLAVATPLMFPAGAAAATYDVCASGCADTSIQTAIESATPGSTITVGPGSYTENVNIDKTVSVVGAGAATTIIVATDANSTPLTFNASNASVSGFTITHQYTSGDLAAWNFNNNGVGFGQTRTGNTLSNCVITLSRNGIYLNNTQNNVITNNTITNNRTGINLTNHLNGTQITGNTISNNWTEGLVTYDAGIATDYSTVTLSGNTFDQNWYEQVVVKSTPLSTGTLDVTNNTFTDSPVTYTTSSSSSLDEPGFAAQQPTSLGGTATKPAQAFPTLRAYNSGSVALQYAAKTLKVGAGEPYATIQSAINDASAGDTISVDNGTYNESLNITTNNIAVVGQSQAGVILNETSATPFGQGISLDGVSGDSISNMTVNTPQGAPVSYALQAYQAPGLTLSNLSFNGPGKTGTNSHGSKIGGVDVSSSQNVTYDNVSVSNYSKNGFSVTVKYTDSDTASSGLSFNGITTNNNNWAGLAFYTVGNDHSPVSTGGSGNITGVSFNGKNTFTNNSQGVFIEGDSDANFISSSAPSFSVTGPSGSTLAITGSVFGGNTQAIVNYQTGALNASPNYWNSASGPAVGQIVDGFGAVTTAPYYIGSDMTVRSDAKVAPDTSGNATVDNSTPQVVVTDSTQPVTITVTSGTSGAGVDFSSLVTSNTGTIPQTTINSTSASVSIPAATTVTATGGTWDGVITAPTVQSNTSVTVPTPSGTTTTVGTVIEVGAGNISLTFDNAVRLLIPGQAGKLVGFARNGTFTQITDACSADSQTAGDVLAAGGNCYINVGSDMVVWTKHFTTFATYTQAPTPASNSTSSSATSAAKSSSSNGSDSNAAAPEVLGVSTPTAKTLSTSTAKPTVAAAAKPNSGKILGMQWYLWLIALAVLGAAGYSVYRYAEGTDSK